MVCQKMLTLGAQPSAIRELFAWGRAVAAKEGEAAVLDFSLGNPSVPPPAAVASTIVQAVEKEPPLAVHGYTPAAGAPAVREAIASDLRARFTVPVSADDLFLTCGAAPGLTAVLAALAADDAESEVLSIAPFFPEYRVFTEAAGHTFRVIAADEETFQIDFAALAAALSEKTAAIIINSPNNPSGAVYTKETIQKLAALLAAKEKEVDHPIYLIADEPYRELSYGIEVPFLPQYYANSIVCYSYSKSLSLPGERIGYLFVPPAAAEHDALLLAIAGAARVAGHVCAPSLMQRVIASCATLLPETAVYQKNARLLYEGMTKAGFRCARPDGAFYLFFQAPAGLSGEEFSLLARDRYHILVVPGSSFGCPRWLRLAYCVPTERVERALPLLCQLKAEIEADC